MQITETVFYVPYADKSVRKPYRIERRNSAGNYHSKDERTPAITTFHHNGKRSAEWYYHDGILSNQNRPAVIRWHPCGVMSSQEFWVDGRLSRDNGPCVFEFFPNGSIRYELSIVNNLRHKADGNAIAHYNDSGQLIRWEKWEMGRLIDFGKC